MDDMTKPAADPATAMRGRLQGDLREAMKRRDTRGVALLRTLIAAIDNAEAVALPQTAGASRLTGGSIHIATGPAGASEVPRRVLSAVEVDGVLAAEQASRREAAALVRSGGRPSDAEALEADADAVNAYRAPA